METTSTQTTPSAEPPAGAGPSPLPWPPPGLGRLQGDAYAVARWLAAGAVLVLPLLAALVLETDPWVIGLGQTLTVVMLVGIVGVPILAGGHAMFIRLLARARSAASKGYGLRLIALTACDRRRDTGFLLQGARAYGVLPPNLRRMMVAARILAAGLFLGAALWLSVGFGLAVVLAARGLLGPTGLALLTLLPAAGMVLAGAFLQAGEEGVIRRARKAWYRKPWAAELAGEEIRAWNAALTEREGVLDVGGRTSVAWLRGLRAAVIAGPVLFLVAFVPIFMLLFASMVVPILGVIVLPNMERTQQRVVAIEPLRRFALEPDPAISMGEAGEIMHVLIGVGDAGEPLPGMRSPVRRYEAHWLPERDPALPQAAAPLLAWFIGLLEDPRQPLDPVEAEYLALVAAHPAHAEFARVARAGALDLASARWVLPIPETMSLATVPMPRYTAFRTGAYAQIGKAAWEARAGRTEDAETTLRQVVSTGLLLSDHGSTLLDNLIGVVVAGVGGDALEALYRGAGRPEAAELAWAREAARRAAGRLVFPRSGTAERTLGPLTRLAADSAAIPGLRWENYLIVTTLAPCMSPRRIVFGPGPEYEEWIERVEAGLVRSPGDQHLFDAGRRGFLGWEPWARPDLRTRLVTLTMGGVDREGSCGWMLAASLASF